MADEIKAAEIEKFDGTNFGYWKMQIEDYLYGKKLHLPLLGSKPENMPEEDLQLLDRQVLGIKKKSCSQCYKRKIHCKTNGSFVWDV